MDYTCSMAIVNFLLLIAVVRFSDGFLLDTKNTTSTGKPLYLTVSEYYGDKNQMHRDLEKLHQEMESQHQQQEVYRDQQEKTLQLLTTQLQQRFEAMEQKINGKNETQQQTIDSLVLKYQELEQKYTTVKKTQDAREQVYQELEQKYTTLKKTQDEREQLYHELEQNYTQLQKVFDEKNRICTTEIGSVTNKTLTLEHKIDGLEQLKSVNQLKDFQTLQQKVQTFDSSINLLKGHEQARNQDFLALYNLTTMSRSEIHELANKTLNRFNLLERNHNSSLAALQNAENQKFDTLNNFTSVSRSKMNAFANSTSEKLDMLAHNLTMSFSALQQNIDKNNDKVVLTSCRYNGDYGLKTGSVITFPKIITAIGITNPSSFTSTGKFTCQVPGIYHISTVITSNQDNMVINVMKNSVKVHYQFNNGYTSGNHWTPGATVVAIELKTNDNVWIQYASSSGYTTYYSCFTIFKI